MNAHNPFDAKQDWTNPYCQNSSNDPMVDALLGNAYHVVRTVYCNLGNLKLLYDFLNQYGMVLGVQSEAELKALTTDAKYARIYGFSRAGDRQVTDYLYVEGDRTGIIPDDPEATGSWITVATTGSNGGGTSSSEGAYIPWVYSNGSATGGETSINVPDGTVGVPFIIVNGDMQYVGRGFEFNADNLSVTLAQPLEEGDEVVFLLTGVPAVPDNPNVNDWVQINWLYNNGAAVGGEQVIAVPYTFQSIPAVYKNGLRLYKGLASESYTADPDNQRILLTEPLATNDRLIVQIGGEAQVLETSDHTLQEVARATNVKDSEVILSTDTTQFLNGKKIVYSVSEQKSYRLPTLPTNVFISSVNGNQLTYNPGGIVVDLLPAPNDVIPVENELQAYKTAMVTDGGTLVNSGLSGVSSAIKRTIDSHFKDYYNVKDFGAVGDGVTDDTEAIQLAVSFLGDLTTKTMFSRPSVLFFPEGDYLTSKPIILWDGVTLRGASQSSTRIQMTSSTNTTEVTTNSPVRNLPRNVNCILAVFSSGTGYPYRTTISDIQLYGIAGTAGVTTGKVAYAIYAPEAAFLTVERVRTWYTNYGIMSYNLWMSTFRDLDLREHAEWSFLLSNDSTGRGGSTSISLERVYGHTSEGGIKLYGANYSTLSSCGVDAAGSSNPSAADAASKAPYVFESCQGLVANSLGAESIYTSRCIIVIGGHVTLNEPDLYAWRGDVTGRRMYGVHVTVNGNLVLNGGRLYGIQFRATDATECFAVVQSDGVNGSVQCNGSLISDASVDSEGTAIGNIFFGSRTYRGRTIQQEAGISRYQTNTLTLIASVTTGDLFSSGLDTTRYTVIDAVAQIHSNSPTLDQAKLKVQVMNVSANSARIWIINPDGTANFTAQTLRVTFTYRVN
ncbi:glycosyl hydrolase family 28-related protein [Escherichia coli]